MPRKNSGGFAGMSFSQIMMSQAMKALDSPVYCRYCGQDIKQPSQNSTRFMTGDNTGRWYNDWELANHAHEKCHHNHIYGYRR
jgi:hypothetical protein